MERRAAPSSPCAWRQSVRVRTRRWGGTDRRAREVHELRQEPALRDTGQVHKRDALQESAGSPRLRSGARLR
eukprot:7300221-Alexandrium_andersonii.AAC.1